MLFLYNDTWYDFTYNMKLTESGWEDVSPTENKLDLIIKADVILFDGMLFRLQGTLGFVSLEIPYCEVIYHHCSPEDEGAEVCLCMKEGCTGFYNSASFMIHDVCMNCHSDIVSDVVQQVVLDAFKADGSLALFRCGMCGVMYYKFYPLIYESTMIHVDEILGDNTQSE